MTGAVWWYFRPLIQYSSSMDRSRYQLLQGVLRDFMATTARELMVIGASPGGQLRDFWLPL